MRKSKLEMTIYSESNFKIFKKPHIITAVFCSKMIKIQLLLLQIIAAFYAVF